MAALRTWEDDELEGLKAALSDTLYVGKLVELTKTLDQVRAVLTFLEASADHGEGNNVAGGLYNGFPHRRARKGEIGRYGALSCGRDVVRVFARMRHSAEPSFV